MTYLKMAWRNSLSNWRYSLASILTIAAGFVSMSLFQGYILELDRSYFEGITRRLMQGEIVIEKNPSILERRLSVEDQEFVEGYFNKKPVKLFVRSLDLSGSISTSRKSGIVFGYGIDVANAAKLRDQHYWNTLSGVPLKSQSEILLGRGLSKILGCEVPPETSYIDTNGRYIPIERSLKCEDDSLLLTVNTVDGQANAMDFTMTGITNALTKEVDDYFVLLAIEDAQRLLDTNTINRYAVLAHDNSKDGLARYTEDFNELAKKSDTPLVAKVWTSTQLGDFYVRAMELIRVYRNFIGAIFILIAALAIFNTTLKVIHERIREIGTLRSLGFKNLQLKVLFLLETLIMASIGCACGWIISIALSLSLNRLGVFYKAGILSEPVPFQIAISLPTYLFLSLLLVSIAVISAQIPVRSALSKKIVDNLSFV